MSTRVLTIEQIVSRTTDLPSIPAAAFSVMRETEKADASASSIAQHLATDQALTVRVLRLANSPFYGLSRRVNDLTEAVVVLGMRTVKNLAMVASTYPWLTRSMESTSLGPAQLWTHAFATAVGSQEVAVLSKKVKSDVAFTAGLLHDIGKVALWVWLDSRVMAIAGLAYQQQLSFDDAERQVLGFDHTQVGEHLGKAWNLPEDLCQVARYHHHPDLLTKPDSLVDCIHVGNYLATNMGFGLAGDSATYTFEEKALDRLGLTFSALDGISDSFVATYEKHEQMFQQLAA